MLLNNLYLYFSAVFLVWNLALTGAKRVLQFLQSLMMVPFTILSNVLRIPSCCIFAISVYMEICYYACKSVMRKAAGACGRSGEQAKIEKIRCSLKFDHLLNEKPNPKISVIIPCYNEVSTIVDVVTRALDDVNVEVIISDGGSTDGTLAEVNKAGTSSNSHCIKTIHSAGSNRSECLNTGSLAATGDILLFLHADTLLPHDWGHSVRRTLLERQILIGAFGFRFLVEDTKGKPLLRLIEWGTNIRSRYFHLPYGDQALFCYKSVFFTLGQFPVQPFMEDYDFIISARSIGKVQTMSLDSSNPIQTSARRWIDNGIISNTLWNSFVILGHSVGVPTKNLARWYYSSADGKKTY